MGGRMKEMVTRMGSNGSRRSYNGPLPLDRLYHPKRELYRKKAFFYERMKKKKSSLKYMLVFESLKLVLETKYLE